MDWERDVEGKKYCYYCGKKRHVNKNIKDSFICEPCYEKKFVEEVPGTIECRGCGNKYHAVCQDLACLNCGVTL